MEILVRSIGLMVWGHTLVCSELGDMGGICDSDAEQSSRVAEQFSVSGFSALTIL